MLFRSLGKITKWNDPRIAALNPGVKLPATDLLVVHRSDGSGTSYIFTDYLSKVNATWKSKVGKATAVKWPLGLGGKGNDGSTAMNGGLQLQLELHTRIALTARFGVVKAHGDRETDALVGFSIY